MNRRRFLKQTGCVAVGGLSLPYLVSSSALGKAGAVAASERITVGFIGTGGHGIDMNLKSFLAQPDAQAVAVCDVDPVNLHKARDLVNARYDNTDCMTTQDFREILARADIDAVMISTPDHWHVPISIAAARAGKDVECEKPTLTVEEGRRLVQTMQRYGRVFQWSTEDRSVAAYHRMCELVRHGRIGKAPTITARPATRISRNRRIQSRAGASTSPSRTIAANEQCVDATGANTIHLGSPVR